jgi:hypothetical protein
MKANPTFGGPLLIGVNLPVVSGENTVGSMDFTVHQSGKKTKQKFYSTLYSS